MEKYIKLNKPIMDMQSEQLRKLFPGKGTSNSYLMRSIILNEKDYLSIDYDRSLRGFWYSTVKPTLDKLGLLTEKDQEEDTLVKWDALLSKYMGDLVRMGLITYRDLNIVDTSRQRNVPTYNCFYSNIIICTEKDTVFPVISDIANFFRCSCMSSKGQNSIGATEDLLRSIGHIDKDIYILTLTDYDPAGYSIADTFKNQIEDLQLALHMKNKVHIERIGILPGQLTASEIERNKYTPKPKDREKWFLETGGINGEPKGLELDALSPDRIREIFVTKYQKIYRPRCLLRLD